MKSIPLKALIFLVVVLISLFSVHAVKIDGIDGGVEWENAEFLPLLKDKDSNNVNFGSVSYIVDDNGFDIYFMIFFSDFDSANYNSSGVILTLGSDVITVDVNGNVDNPKPDLYHIEAAVLVAENDGCYCELLVGYKLGLPANLSCKVSFIDGEGTHSYHYPFDVINAYAVNTTVKSESPMPRPDNGRVTKAVTTKPKTTKRKTTKEETSNKETTIVYVFVTQPPTRQPTKSVTRNRVTKAQNTSVSETKPIKTTKVITDNSVEKTVVYYFEKEVIVSEVYVTSGSVASAEPVCQVYSENFVQQNTSDENAAKYNEGVKIFRVVCVVAGLLLGVFAAWAGLNNKKSNGSDNLNSSDSSSNPADDGESTAEESESNK